MTGVWRNTASTEELREGKEEKDLQRVWQAGQAPAQAADCLLYEVMIFRLTHYRTWMASIHSFKILSPQKYISCSIFYNIYDITLIIHNHFIHKLYSAGFLGGCFTNLKSIGRQRIRVRRGRIGSGVCFPPQKTKERNLETTTDLFMIYSSMKNQQMSLVAFSFQRNSSLKEMSSAKSLTIDPSRRRVQQRAKLMELVCIGSQKSVHWVTKIYSIFKSGGLGLL